MGKKTSKTNKTKLRPIAIKFLDGMKWLIDNEIVRNENDFTLNLGLDKTTISKIRNRSRKITLRDLENLFTKFDFINPSYFFRTNEPIICNTKLKDVARDSAQTTITTSGPNSTIITGDNVTSTSNNKESQNTQYNSLEDLNKMLDDYKAKCVGLNQEIKKFKADLGLKETELINVKNELLDVYRENRINQN